MAHARRKGMQLTIDQRRFVNSKAIRDVFMREFIMRRMNTSYKKVLTWAYHQFVIDLEEQWTMQGDYSNMAESVIVLRMRCVREAGSESFRNSWNWVTTRWDIPKDGIIGRSFADGILWLHENWKYLISPRAWRAIRGALNSTEKIRDANNGTWYKVRLKHKSIDLSAMVIDASQSWTEVVNQNWRV